MSQRAEKSITAVNFMRSTKAPITSAGVMMAKVIWKAQKRVSGIFVFEARLSLTPPPSRTFDRPPKNWFPSLKATL